MITLCFTYDIVTDESAADGDVTEHGFYEYGGWTYPMGITGETYERPVWKPGNLRSFISTCQDLGISFHGDAYWAYSIDEDIDYRTGERTTYAAHVDGCTPSTHARIMRLLSR